MLAMLASKRMLSRNDTLVAVSTPALSEPSTSTLVPATRSAASPPWNTVLAVVATAWLPTVKLLIEAKLVTKPSTSTFATVPRRTVRLDLACSQCAADVAGGWVACTCRALDLHLQAIPGTCRHVVERRARTHRDIECADGEGIVGRVVRLDEALHRERWRWPAWPFSRCRWPRSCRRTRPGRAPRRSCLRRSGRY